MLLQSLAMRDMSKMKRLYVRLTLHLSEQKSINLQEVNKL